MDVTVFYALFSATCFTLVGLWWTVVTARPAWMADRDLRRSVGGIYAAFLLPAMMGLFAQVGGTEHPRVWRASFVVIAVIGAVSTISLLSRGDQRAAVPVRALAGLVYVVIAVVGVRPEIVADLDVKPIEAEAMLLILLVGLAHALAWRFMAEHSADPPETDEPTSRHRST